MCNVCLVDRDHGRRTLQIDSHIHSFLKITATKTKMTFQSKINYEQIIIVNVSIEQVTRIMVSH